MSFKGSLFKLFESAPSKSVEKIPWDDKFFVSQTPPEWFPLRNRTFWWCAHYSLKAVIEWKSGQNRPIEYYSADWWSWKTYLMTPWWILKVLKRNKLKYRVIKVKWLTDWEKLSLLKDNLKRGPIILLVANWQTRKKRFSWWKALTHWHYISLRWFDDENMIFYVYDSNTRRKTLRSMKWILKIPYIYILKEWWIWASKLIYNFAIAVRY